jgi:hypothetical protein
MTSVLDLWRGVDPATRLVSGDPDALRHPVRGVARTRAVAPHLPPLADGQLLIADATVVADLDDFLAAVADAGLSLADIDGLTTYPGASGPGPGFSGASLRDIHDTLGIRPNWVAGGVESPGQLGAVVDAMLAVAGGLATHVLCWRSIW